MPLRLSPEQEKLFSKNAERVYGSRSPSYNVAKRVSFQNVVEDRRVGMFGRCGFDGGIANTMPQPA